MATRAANEARKIQSNEKIAELDRRSREREGKKDRQTSEFNADKQLAGNAMRAVGSFAGKFNHPEWYKKFVPMEYRANLPTFTRLGQVMAPNWLGKLSSFHTTINQTVNQAPGILVIAYLSSLPNQKIGNQYYTSPINVGLSRFMAQLRKFNSRVGEYDPADFGLYWYTAADLLYWIETVRFIIKTYNTYHATNSYLAKILIEAKGFSYTDVADNITLYKALCSKYIEIFNTNVVIPKELTFFKRRLWLASTIIGDHNSKKAQLYTFRQEATGYLSADESTYDCSFYNTTANALLSYTTVEGRIDTIARSLIDSVGIQVMIQDLRAAMKEQMFFKLDQFDGHAQLEIIYSDNDLEQIHNILTTPGITNIDSHPYLSVTYGGLSIHSMPDGYLYQGTLGSGGVVSNSGPYLANIPVPATATASGLYDNQYRKAYDESPFLNFYHDDVSEDSVLEATRLRVADMYIEDSLLLYPRVRGTEVPIYFIAYNANDSVSDGYSRYLFTSFNQISNLTSSVREDIIGFTCSVISKFDWCPVIRFSLTDAATTPTYDWISHGELDNYFPCNGTELKLIHEGAALSEFYLEDKDFTGGNFVTR